MCPSDRPIQSVNRLFSFRGTQRPSQTQLLLCITFNYYIEQVGQHENINFPPAAGPGCDSASFT